MKTSLTVLSLLAVLFSAGAMARTVLIDFGGTNGVNTPATSGAPWNIAGGTTVNLTTDRITGSLNDTTGTSWGLSARYNTGALLVVPYPPVNTALTAQTAQQALGTSALSLWQQAHGSALTDARIQNGWSENIVLGVGDVAAPGTINIGGLAASSSYTISAVFTVSGLANIASLMSTAPVTLQGNNFTTSHAYLAGNNAQIVDVNVGSIDLASLVKTGTFMMTWQLSTTAGFNGMINMDFANSLLSAGGQYGISAMAVTEGTPNLTIPEPSAVLLGAFGFAGLMLRRRRK